MRQLKIGLNETKEEDVFIREHLPLRCIMYCVSVGHGRVTQIWNNYI